jgi:biopolymer transport protein TolR
MKRKMTLTSMKDMSEINLTPLIDLTFLLLITFIITFPLIEEGIPVNLPTGKARELKPDTARTVTVDKLGDIHLDNVKLTLEEFAKEMETASKIDSSVMVMVRGDVDIKYGRIVDVLKVLNSANITKMALVTQSE